MKNNGHFNPIVDDLTILTLTKKVRGVEPATLSNKKNKEIQGMRVQTGGWGELVCGDDGPRSNLRTATLDVLNRSDCQIVLRQHNLDENSLPDSFICTKADPFVVLTKGDSGGPLFYKGDRVLAINRSICPYYVPECSRVNIHIGIDHYRNFIKEALKSK
ncbi:hypothetical protein QAD02_006127 [Eretmocerus hayati]|uniref:Uncharacterized protein n=1 Tax=Eretmocerus hayati TaxID=131215 RepID=A0ACC2N071_9HYME|nr:hypothetical protein QAD02_006127 [Eretmocerus hayati]